MLKDLILEPGCQGCLFLRIAAPSEEIADNVVLRLRIDLRIQYRNGIAAGFVARHRLDPDASPTRRMTAAAPWGNELDLQKIALLVRSEEMNRMQEARY